jgi:DNA-binding NarL/FixJ family response regulator
MVVNRTRSAANGIRIAVVDRQPIFRVGLVDTLATRRLAAVVAEGESADDLRRIARESKPDILIFDPGISGDSIVVAERAQRARPALKVVILTSSDDDDDVAEALGSGVRGYILKDVSAEELMRAIERIGAGETYITPSLASRLLVKTKGKPLAAGQAGAASGLTQRDRRVLRCLTKGLSNRELASDLGVNLRTAKYYLSQLYKKMGVQGRVDAILAAQRMKPSRGDPE